MTRLYFTLLPLLVSMTSQEHTPVKVMPLSTPEATPIHPGIWSQGRQGGNMQRSMRKWELERIQKNNIHDLPESQWSH